jgi:hypothetical protein
MQGHGSRAGSDVEACAALVCCRLELDLLVSHRSEGLGERLGRNDDDARGGDRDLVHRAADGELEIGRLHVQAALGFVEADA